MLKEYVQQNQQERRQDVGASGSKSLGKQSVTGVIHIITGATEEWAQSKSKRKQHLRSMMAIEGSSKRAKEDESWQIKFSPLDTDIMQDSGNDPIAVSAIINTFLIERILIDDGSAVEVLMWKAFKEMGLEENQLKPSGLIYGFANQPIRSKGIITLPITIGQGEHTTTVTADFLVVDQPSAYNAIIGRPLMKKTNMVSAVYCLTIKFPTPTGVGYIKADQATARQCHIQAIHLSRQAVSEPEKAITGDVLAIDRSDSGIGIEDLDPREDYPKPEPVEQTEAISISGEGRTTR